MHQGKDSEQPPHPGEAIRVLFVEDVSIEAELALHHLGRGGLDCTLKRVETQEQFVKALEQFRPSVIFSDYTLPQFSGADALALARQLAPDVPFIFVSGTIGEERAIEALRQGATDYVLKSNLARLAPAVTHALADAAGRAERRRQEARIARLTRVLRMLSGINAMVLRIRDRDELVSEACRLAAAVGGYASAIVLLRQPGMPGVRPVAAHGRNVEGTEILRSTLADSGLREDSIVGRVLTSKQAFVCNDTIRLTTGAELQTDPTATGPAGATSAVMALGGFRSLVALPLLVDKAGGGVLVITATEAGTISEGELRMLREVAATLSYALEYLQKDTEVKLLSHFDARTGLAKRALFCERVDRWLAQLVAHEALRAVAVIDVEQLSVINDSFGRHLGDLLLEHVGDRLRRHFANSELLGHLGGGAFAVGLQIESGDEGPHGTDAVRALDEHLTEIFGLPLQLEETSIPVAMKAGVALHPQNGADAATLLQNAEAALRTTRATGQRSLLYSAEQHSGAKARLALEHKLRLALAVGQFELHYQAKINLKTRLIDGAEALIRWNDPESGRVSPAAFLPVLESTGLIVEVGEWVIEQAARDNAHWRELGIPPLRVAVNIAPAQLNRVNFGRNFPDGLDIEITEGTLLDDSAALTKKLNALRSAGVRVAIDDFGTGYSSLSRFAALPIDILKIDRQFIAPLPGNQLDKAMVQTILTLAHSFGRTVVAEGVETAEQLAALSVMGCDQAQGFFLGGQPLGRDDFTKLLTRNQKKLGR